MWQKALCLRCKVLRGGKIYAQAGPEDKALVLMELELFQNRRVGEGEQGEDSKTPLSISCFLFNK